MNTFFHINSKVVEVNIVEGEIIGISDESLTEVISYLIPEWQIQNNTADVFHVYESNVEVTAPDGEKHHCLHVSESRTSVGSGKDINVVCLRNINTIKKEYIDADIDREGIVQLINDSIAQGDFQATFTEHNFSFKALPLFLTEIN